MSHAHRKQNPGYGVLFPSKNTRADGSPVSPHAPGYTGRLTTPDGEEFELAAWIKTGQNGKKFMNITLKRPQQKRLPDTGDQEQAETF